MMIKTKLLAVAFLVLSPLLAFGQTVQNGESIVLDAVFEARVIRILEEKEIVRENGETFKQQNILLRGVSGEHRDKEIEHFGISDFDVLSADIYKVGDFVVVQQAANTDGTIEYIIVDHVRRNQLYVLALVFAVMVILIGKMKGVKALLGLVASFFVLVAVMLPLILKGVNPLAVAVVGSLVILAVVVYTTEGWCKKSHLAVASAFVSLLATVIVSFIFSNLAKLTGLMQEGSAFLISIGENVIDFKGLMLAGMIIGAIGVLDDVIVSQIETVEQIKQANPALSSAKVFKMAYQVGTSHLGSMVNTLFLTYAGASLPLLLLFVVKVEPFSSVSMTLNHEIIATEIVRSFAGGIGVALSLPISTYLAVRGQSYRTNRQATTDTVFDK
jgi:uncharacterized membrane protein